MRCSPICASALWRVDRGLAFEFGPAVRPRDFVVSADGIVELFPVATRLVEAAPPMSDWHVIAFRQPGKPSLAVEFDGQSLGADDLWFRVSRSGSRTNLEAHIRGLTEANTRLLMGAAFILLDNALGEYVVGTRIGAIDWQPLARRSRQRRAHSADSPAGGGGHLTEAWASLPNKRKKLMRRRSSALWERCAHSLRAVR